MSSLPCRKLGLVLAAILLATGCGDGARLDVGGTCLLNSDCNSPLVCTMNTCHEGCRATTDCPAGQSCVKLGGLGVCQLPIEAECSASLPCGPLLICASDLRCRSRCATAADCMTLQLCVGEVCADSKDLDVGGNLPQKQAGLDAGQSDTASSAPTDVPSAPDAPAEAAPEAGAEAQPDSAPDAPAPSSCGAFGQICCASQGCNTSDLGCSATLGTCVKCGGPSQPCCAGDTCTGATVCAPAYGGGKACFTCGSLNSPCCAGSTCTAAQTACSNSGSVPSCVTCGMAGQPCCTGDQCWANSLCISGTCQPCGGASQQCCSGNTCPNTNPSIAAVMLDGLCQQGTCEQCGQVGQQCCANDLCLPTGIGTSPPATCISGRCVAAVDDGGIPISSAGSGGSGGVTGSGGTTGSGGSGGTISNSDAASGTRPGGYWIASDWGLGLPWQGCAWTAIDTISGTSSTMSPRDFVANHQVTDPYHVVGSVFNNYNAFAMLGFNLNEAITGDGTQCFNKPDDSPARLQTGLPAVVFPTSTTGLAIRFSKTGSFTFRVQIQGPDGSIDANQRWCSDISQAASPVFILYSDFYTQCWNIGTSNSPGYMFNRETISTITLMTVGANNTGSGGAPFDFAVQGFAPGNSAADAP